MNNPISDWRNVTKLNLKASQCQKCKQILFPTRKVCSVCLNTDPNKFTSIPLPKEGVIMSLTKIYKSSSRFENSVPYSVAIIRLPKINLNIVGQLIDSVSIDYHIGSKVKAKVRKMYEDGPAGHIYYGVKWLAARS